MIRLLALTALLPSAIVSCVAFDSTNDAVVHAQVAPQPTPCIHYADIAIAGLCTMAVNLDTGAEFTLPPIDGYIHRLGHSDEISYVSYEIADPPADSSSIGHRLLGSPRSMQIPHRTIALPFPPNPESNWFQPGRTETELQLLHITIACSKEVCKSLLAANFKVGFTVDFKLEANYQPAMTALALIPAR